MKKFLEREFLSGKTFFQKGFPAHTIFFTTLLKGEENYHGKSVFMSLCILIYNVSIWLLRKTKSEVK